MGDCEDEILKMSSPPQEVGDVDSTPVYDPSPEIPSHFDYDLSFTGPWYWLLSDETHNEPISNSYIHYGIPDIPAHDPAHHAESEIEPSTTPGALLFLSMRRDLGALVTLHLPSQWWKKFHMSILDLVLVTICGYQKQNK